MAVEFEYQKEAKEYAVKADKSRKDFFEVYQDILDNTINYDESKVPSYTLPELLKNNNGKTVTNAREWIYERRMEILDLLQREMYGKILPRPDQMEFEMLSQNDQALNGIAIRREVRIHTKMNNGRSFSFDMLIYIPKNAPKPVPAFLGLNFRGNHACTVEKDVMMTPVRYNDHRFKTSEEALAFYGEDKYLPIHDPGFYGEDKRGAFADRFCFEEVIKRGYASATICYHDIFPDSCNGWDNSCMTLFGDFKDYVGGHKDYTSIGAWAWGLSRGLDYLETCPEINAARVCVHGHSRLGKTSLWTGAIDRRFYMTISNDSGCGGAALAKRCLGETFLYIVNCMPHWFSLNMRKYIANEDAMPFDQHYLLSLIAPRLLAVASATEDLWADPKGEFLAAKKVNEVYALFGSRGLEAETMPAPDTPVTGEISYHIRTGKHAILPFDWSHYLDIMDRYTKG